MNCCFACQFRDAAFDAAVASHLADKPVNLIAAVAVALLVGGAGNGIYFSPAGTRQLISFDVSFAPPSPPIFNVELVCLSAAVLGLFLGIQIGSSETDPAFPTLKKGVRGQEHWHK